MKKGVALLFMCIFSISLVSASCNLVVHLIEQDPYPAIPGESVRLLFQVRGAENRECTDVVFLVSPEYPFSLGPEQDPIITIKGGTYTRNFDAFLMVPYEVRIDKHAIEGDNKLKVQYSKDKTRTSFIEQDFDINVQDVRTDFEIFIRDYDASQRRVTFEILNIGKNDIESLTLEIPKQENIIVKGSNRNIVGFLDSNDFTTTSFEATPSEGEIEVIIYYTDIINQRRIINKTILFEPDYFKGRLRDEKSFSVWFYIISVLLLGAVVYYFYSKNKKAKKKKHLFGDSN